MQTPSKNRKEAGKATPNPGMFLYLTRWVKQHPHGWNHQDWLDLLAELDKRNYTYEPDKVGVYIEGKRREMAA